MNKEWHAYIKEKEKYLDNGGKRLFLADDYQPAYKDPKVKVTVITQTPQSLLNHQDTNIDILRNTSLSKWCAEHDGY